MGTVSAYLDGLGEPERVVIGRVYAIALDVAPESVEGTAYGMPALRYRDQGFAAAVGRARFISLYPFSGGVLPALAESGILDGFEVSMGTLRFTLDRPPADDVLRAIFVRRRAEIDG